MSGVNDNPFETEFGVLEGVVDDGNIPASVSIFTGVLLEKSKLLLIGAVVSVGCKITTCFIKHILFIINILRWHQVTKALVGSLAQDPVSFSSHCGFHFHRLWRGFVLLEPRLDGLV